jgi:hypothetical protein
MTIITNGIRWCDKHNGEKLSFSMLVFFSQKLYCAALIFDFVIHVRYLKSVKGEHGLVKWLVKLF